VVAPPSEGSRERSGGGAVGAGTDDNEASDIGRQGRSGRWLLRVSHSAEGGGLLASCPLIAFAREQYPFPPDSLNRNKGQADSLTGICWLLAYYPQFRCPPPPRSMFVSPPRIIPRVHP